MARQRVVITGSLTELPPVVVEHLSAAIQSGAMWARFGQVECLGAPRCRASGLVAIGIDRLVVPEMTEQPAKKSAAKTSSHKRPPAKKISVTKNQK